MELRKELAQYRLSEAERCLKSAKLLLQSGDYKSTANRAYYAVFNAIRSILALQGKDFKKHSAVISYFQQNYIKTNVFESTLSDIVAGLYTIRHRSDYDDFYLIDKQKVSEQIANAEYFLQRISAYLSNHE